ncbi:MAG TPA: diguanylate cyclase, partial [Syntrophomonadaceae bacterium]|nr:diguanylate cyclase [Syntrophomonadaceae bacterium]
HQGDTIAHPEFKRVEEAQNHILEARTDEGFEELASLEQRMIQHIAGVGSYDFEQVRKIMGFAPVPRTDWSIAVTAVEDEVLAELNTMQRGIIGTSVLAILLGLLLAFYLGRQLRRPLLHAAWRCQEMAAGNFSTVDREGYSQSKDEIGTLFQGFDKINQDVSKLIEELRHSKQRFQHMAEHDALTGLHNRYYVETRVRKLDKEEIVPIGVIVCDLDGLKLVNDTFGEKNGDKLLLVFADILKKHKQPGWTIARSSGDEYLVLLPGLGINETEELCHQIKKSIEEYNHTEPEVPLSVSMGSAVRLDSQYKISDTIIEAVQHMHHRKLFQHKSMRSTLVDLVMKTLEARDYFTEGHTDRLQGLVRMMADDLDFRDHQIDTLCLLARFHDIGKVGIPDHILLKPGRLTKEEYQQMKKHSEIGYRIARTSPDLAPIADWILMHHEWWDGSGYPLGIKGEEIPIECRILAIADAFDAMVSDRPYRKALSFQEALEQLKNGAGTQFDPYLVEQFIFRIQSI